MKENENTRGSEGSGWAGSNTPAVTSDLVWRFNSQESRSSCELKREVNWGWSHELDVAS